MHIKTSSQVYSLAKSWLHVRCTPCPSMPWLCCEPGRSCLVLRGTPGSKRPLQSRLRLASLDHPQLTVDLKLYNQMGTVNSLHSVTQQFPTAPSLQWVSTGWDRQQQHLQMLSVTISKSETSWPVFCSVQSREEKREWSKPPADPDSLPEYPYLSRNHHTIFKRCSKTLTVRAITGEINDNMTPVLFNFTSLCKALDSAVSMTYFIYCLFLFLFFFFQEIVH